ncbi:MAG TPA: hypothetical protein VK168_07295 [Saprospiraceae bacterium]|nr:hypothetical protein [Saprospiraceae bacterium]
MKKLHFCLMIILALGCQKENPVQKIGEEILSAERDLLPSEIQILNLLQLPTDGYAAITSYATLSTQPFRGPEIIIRAYGYNKAGIKSDFGALTVGTVVANPISSTNNDYLTVGAPGAKDLYGTNSAITLDGKNGLPGFLSDFYIPKMMTISSPTFSNNSTITEGTTITWEADNNNSIGVGIAISFDPLDFANQGLNAPNGPVLNVIHIDDTGSYSITANDLAGIPANARITVGLGRGNYKRVSMPNDYHFGLIAYSIVAHPFTKL